MWLAVYKYLAGTSCFGTEVDCHMKRMLAVPRTSLNSILMS